MPIAKKSNKTTKNPSRFTPQPQLTSEEAFWKAVAEKSERLIADLIEKTLPISATPDVFDPEKDVDYRILLRDDLPNYYAGDEEYQEKIATGDWDSSDVDDVAQELVCIYFDLVAKALANRLSKYPAFGNTSLSQLKE